jgi:CcmD family protein
MMIILSNGQPQAGTADDRAETFTAVSGGNETYSGSALLVEAYAAIWLILFAWIYLLWRKQASLGERLDGLEKAIDRAAAKDAASAKKSD